MAYQNKKTVDSIYDLPKALRAAMDKKLGGVMVAFKEDITEEKAQVANAIASSIDNFLMSGNYKDMPYSLGTYNWIQDPDGKGYLFNVTMPGYNTDNTSQNISERFCKETRLNGEARDGLSFTEFTYQLLQGYDFLHLYETKGCKLQMGGSDQWGNITTGAELIRRTNGGEVFALTSPLITKADGGKFGKTESGNIWLDPRYTSPYKFYQFWLNVSDADAARYIKIFTSLSREEIEALTAEHETAPHLRVLQSCRYCLTF